VDRGNDAVSVFHGSLVETHDRGFVEGAWNDSFASLNYVDATIVVGTGGVMANDRFRFSASTDQLSPLFSIAKTGSVYVSNSPAFVMTAAGEEPDDVYPFYPYDLVRIYRQGLYCQDGRLRLRSTNSLHVHFTTLISVDEQGSVRCDAHRLCEAPSDYRSYKELLLDGVRKVLENAADAARKRSYRPLASLSRGYDSTAVAALARSAGCSDAFTFIDARSDDPSRDSGAGNARFFLGMSCIKVGRWQYLDLNRGAEAEFGYAPTSSRIPLAAMEGRLAGRVLLVGDSGDAIWDPKRAKVASQLTRTWIRFTVGLSQIEFRLRVGYQVFAPACIAARHNKAIHDITMSEEMRRWSVGGDYDRPIPRRIAEEAGLPRDRFGTGKYASGQTHLTDPSQFSARALHTYRDFVQQRHAQIPRHIYRYWHTRVWWRHFLWDTIGSNRRRSSRPTPLQRHLPFCFNATPLRVSWDYLFTFQWTVATMRDRYALPEEAKPNP